MKTSRTLSALAASAALVVGFTGTANADTTSGAPAPSKAAMQELVNRVYDAPNPKAALSALSPKEKELFRLTTTPYGAPKVHRISGTDAGSNVSAGLMAAAYTGCWGHSDGVEWQNAFGWKLTDSYQRTDICANNGYVTSVTVNNIAGTGAWGWYLDKTYPSTYNAGWEGRGAVQFNWTTNTADRHNDCLRIYVNANGYNWRTDRSCTA